MLKRVITALILAPLALAAIWQLPTAGVALMFALVFGLGALEWARLIGIRQPAAQLLYLAGLLLLMLLAWQLHRSALSMELVFIAGTLWWLFALVLLGRFSRNADTSVPTAAWSGLQGYIVLGFAWLALVTLHGLIDGPYFFTLLLLIVWGADVGAYFAGRRFGQRKLAPRISPGKTWEGALGGLLLALLGVIGLHLVFGPLWSSLLQLLPLVFMTVLFSIVGDLFESMIKRQYGAKDSGNLLPGHGGVLDRIDSLTAAAPIFVMGLLWLRAVL